MLMPLLKLISADNITEKALSNLEIEVLSLFVYDKYIWQTSV